jgi:hypothetical protein
MPDVGGAVPAAGAMPVGLLLCGDLPDVLNLLGAAVLSRTRFSGTRGSRISGENTKEHAVAEGSDLELLDHELADDEMAWVSAVYQDFSAAQDGFSGRREDFDPKETLRGILGKTEHALPAPGDMSGDGPWRLGRNRHGRFAACVFLRDVELHKHSKSRTDQFPMYVIGEADAFSERNDAEPVLTAVTGGGHFHNAPDAPHAFLPKVGKPNREDWEIAFIAITPRNLREDTQEVSAATREAYKRLAGREAPASR